MNSCARPLGGVLLLLALGTSLGATEPVEELGERWGTAKREREYYRIVSLPIPDGLVVEAGAFAVLPDDRVAVGTRHGDLYLLDQRRRRQARAHRTTSSPPGSTRSSASPTRTATFYVTQSCELTRITGHSTGDGRADRFENLCRTTGATPTTTSTPSARSSTPRGTSTWPSGLSKSYHSWALFRGWALQDHARAARRIPDRERHAQPRRHRPQRARRDLLHREPGSPGTPPAASSTCSEGGFMGHPIELQLVPLRSAPGCHARRRAGVRLTDRHRGGSGSPSSSPTP